MIDKSTFDPNLNLDKVFQFTPPLKISHIELPPLPNDWCAQLVDLCSSVVITDNELINQFNRHIGEKSTYHLKSLLIPQLQRIYYRLHGDLNCSLGTLSQDQYKALVSKLLEGITSCTEGFHNRVNGIVDSLQKPRSLAELLYQVRISLVHNVAATLALAATLENEIHTWNRVTIVAAKDALGIAANHQDDRYSGNVSDEKISIALQEEFQNKYTAFNLPFLLTEQLHGLLGEAGYYGRDETGYTPHLAEKLAIMINRCLPVYSALKAKLNSVEANPFDSVKDNFYLAIEAKRESLIAHPWKYFFIIDEDYYYDTCIIYDLDWRLIRQLFFIKLIKENYFTPIQEVHNLLDCAYKSRLFSSENALLGDEAAYIIKLFNEENYSQLQTIRTELPTYWEKLIRHEDFIEQSPALISSLARELQKHPSDQARAGKKISLLIILITAGFIEHSVLSQFVTLLIRRNAAGFNALMLAAKHQPASLKAMLKFLSEPENQLGKDAFKQMFCAKPTNSWNTFKGCNALMLAAEHQSESVKFMLEFLSKPESQFDKDALQQMFLATSTNISHEFKGYNALMLAAEYQPASVKAMLEFLSKPENQLGKDALQQMFRRRADGYDVLMQSKFASVKKAILKFLCEPANQLDQPTRCQLLLRLSEKVLFNTIATLKIGKEQDKCLLDSILVNNSSRLLKYFSKDYFEVHCSNLAYLTKELVKYYLIEQSNQGNLSISSLFKLTGRTRQEKITAAQAFEAVLAGNPCSAANLFNLKASYPALSNGRLSNLFEAAYGYYSAKEANELLPRMQQNIGI